MPGKTNEMLGIGQKSVDDVQIKVSSSSECCKPTQTKKDHKKKVLSGMCRNIALVLTMAVVVVFVIYVVIRENKTCPQNEIPGTNSNVSSTAGKPSKDDVPMMNSETKAMIGAAVKQLKMPECELGSIIDSFASFTYRPYGSSEPYRTRGLEFPFGVLLKRTKLDLTLVDAKTAASSNIHYYYNVDRCRIGGGVQTDKRPYIRGPIVFAVDQECGKVHYFDDGSARWIKYRSSWNITCSRHGMRFCARGGSRWSFSSPKTKVSGVEFQYDALAQKLTSFNMKIKPLNISNNTEPHYFLHVKKCASTDLIGRTIITNTRPSLVFAANQECTLLYAFNEVNATWQGEPGVDRLSCPWMKQTWCQQGSMKNSSATFQFTSSDFQKPKVFGYEYNFTSLQGKLQHLLIDHDLGILHKMSTTDTKEPKYYLSVDRCLNGGAANVNSKPQIRGPLIFAVKEDCSKVFYFSSRSVRWVAFSEKILKDQIGQDICRNKVPIDSNTKTEDYCTIHSAEFTYLASNQGFQRLSTLHSCISSRDICLTLGFPTSRDNWAKMRTWKWLQLLLCFVVFSLPSYAQVYEWGAWGSWSACSVQCGKGIGTRKRRCLKTSSVSGTAKPIIKRRGCTGIILDYRFCHQSDCDDRSENPTRLKVTYQDAYRSRAEQCTELDKQTYNGKIINWKPYMRGHLDMCKLYCLASGHKFYAQLRNRVQDGTPCGRDYSKVCIEGKCQKRPKGCKSIDEPCKVENRKKIIGVFNSTKLHIGYNFVATIPVGATKVNIEELTKSRSYLALKEDKGSTYYLNGHWMISLSKSFQLVGSEAHYKRNGNTRYGGETIKVDGPLEKSVDIMIIYQRDPSTIMYSFFVTEEEYQRLKSKSDVAGQNLYFDEIPGAHPQEATTLKSAKEGRSSPSSPSNGGQDSSARSGSVTFPGKRQPSVYNPADKGGLGYSQRQTKPGQDGDRKSSSWYGSSSWVQFGGGGNDGKPKPTDNVQFPRRPVLSQQVFKRNQFRNPKIPQFGGSNPGTGYGQTRFGNPKVSQYPGGRWQSQGPNPRFGNSKVPGYQRRPWQQPSGRTSDGAASRRFYTGGENQENGRTLNTYVWRTAAFTPCSSTCAGGIQVGISSCTESSSRRIVLDEKCDPKTRPQEQRRVCNLQPCPASWAPQEWKDCSKSCDEGVETRDLMCKQVIDRNGKQVPVMLPVAQCSVHDRPEVVRKCFLNPCPEVPKPKWLPENWGKCSVECDHGLQKRNVICKNHNNDTVEEASCDQKNKPSKLKSCYLGLCRASWYTRTYWAGCSKTCGGGVQSRPVICARVDGSSLNEVYCKDQDKPESSQNCNEARCKGVWMTAEWSKCSTDCGSGLQERAVVCMRFIDNKFQETFDAHCSVDNKPAVTKKCENKNCVPSWFSTSWTACSVTCGHGVQTRHVSCLDGKGAKVGGCKAWQRPIRRRGCHTKRCPGKRKKSVEPNISCVDNPPRPGNYCNIVQRINYCRIHSYRKRCCKTCSMGKVNTYKPYRHGK